LTLGISTSSRFATVALIDENGFVRSQLSEDAPRQASSAVIDLTQRLLAENGAAIEELDFAVDIGPGSFTGLKVGLMLAKTWAHANGSPLRLATSFDLIDPDGPVAVPYKRGSWIIRIVGEEPFVTDALPMLPLSGYEIDGLPSSYPNWAHIQQLWNDLSLKDAIEVVPLYVAEPSISLPKSPFPSYGGGR
jgi:hypothetical protein